jgi:uracil-DNA glycosylase
MMKACQFFCGDVELKKYVQKKHIKNDEIKMAIISEALPKDMNNYFDAGGTPQFIANTNFIFNSIGYDFKKYGDYLNNGIYLTTALKCIKKDYLVSSKTIENCSHLLEQELSRFKNLCVLLLMGDFAIKSVNYIWKRKYNIKVIPTGSTYKIRNGIYEFNGIRFFPSYTQTGDSFGLEKSKVAMISEDVKKAMELLI